MVVVELRIFLGVSDPIIYIGGKWDKLVRFLNGEASVALERKRHCYYEPNMRSLT